MSGRKPDYMVGALDKRTNIKNSRIGAAWINESGNISMHLDPFIVLQQDGFLLVTLFPNDRETKE